MLALRGEFLYSDGKPGVRGFLVYLVEVVGHLPISDVFGTGYGHAIILSDSCFSGRRP